ncbi:DUF6313 family protein [Streptomyces sp. NPDC005263]|uniref:DUF6313 family protein n=1 Tax=Streptomyces sp. NPDC005263 TaxID=3364711 RepID=UPI0036B8D3ED
MPLTVSGISQPNDLDPPPGTNPWRLTRRLWRSRKALSGITQWFIDLGVPVVAVLALAWVLAARAETPLDVYQAVTLMDSPERKWLWLLSLIGWLLVPAIIGGVAGEVIANRIKNVKSLPTGKLYQRRTLGQRMRFPYLIDDLTRYVHANPATLIGAGKREFVYVFVRVAHNNNWRLALNHWEIAVRDAMCTEEYAQLDRHECLRAAQSFALIHLRPPAVYGLCRVCNAR